MIKSFKHKGLRKLFEENSTKGIQPEMASRIIQRLRFLNLATKPEDMNIPGFNLHGLQGEPKRYSVHVNGPWCITFGWEDDGAAKVDLENYH